MIMMTMMMKDDSDTVFADRRGYVIMSLLHDNNNKFYLPERNI